MSRTKYEEAYTPDYEPSPVQPRRPFRYPTALLHQSQELTGFGASSVLAVNELDDGSPSPWRPEPNDGAYGWAIVCFVFMINVVASGHFVCSGIYLPDLSEHFQRSQASMALVLSAETLVNSLTLLFTPHLVRRLGERATCLLGTTISGSGVLLASVTPGYYTFVLAFGVLKSVGTALTLIPSNVMVQKYFSRRRALAAGLSSTGMSAGALCFSLIHRLLIGAYGWRGGLLLFSGFVYQTLVCAALLRPLGARNQAEDKEKMVQKSDDSEKSQIVDEFKEPSEQSQTKRQEGDLKQSGTVDSDTKVMQTSKSTIERLLKCPKLCRKWVVVYIVGKCLSTMGVVVFYKYIVSNAIYQGMDEMSAAALPAIVGFSSTFSRFASGLLSNLGPMRTRRLAQYAAGVFFNGLVVMVAGFTGPEFIHHAVCSLAFGLCFGSHEGISYTVVTDIYGLKRLPAVMSLVDSFSGIIVCFFLPLIGYLWDLTGAFTASFLLAGALQALGGAVFASLLIPTRAVTAWDVQTGKLQGHI